MIPYQYYQIQWGINQKIRYCLTLRTALPLYLLHRRGVGKARGSELVLSDVTSRGTVTWYLADPIFIGKVGSYSNFESEKEQMQITRIGNFFKLKTMISKWSALSNRAILKISNFCWICTNTLVNTPIDFKSISLIVFKKNGNK